MKNKRQLKAEKSQRLAKTVAKKVAAENSTTVVKKSRKQSQLEEAASSENEEKNKKMNRQPKRVKAEKDHIQTTTDRKFENKDCAAGTTNTKKMPAGLPSYDEPPVQDIQRYLETLPSPEIRHFIEGLIVQDKFNMLTIDVAAAIGDIDRMRYYFMRDARTGKARYDVNGRCLDGGTPLHAAIKAKDKESVQLLIENGADLSLVDFMGDNAIMAAIKAGVANMINMLWPYKANLDVNHENTRGRTALHMAAERSWEGCVRFLLSNRACPDVKDRDHVTPLMIACTKGDLKIVDSLLKAGADVGLEDVEFDTPVSRAMVGEKQQLLDCMMKSLDVGRREVYVKDLVYNVMNPPLPEPEYALLEAQYIPALNECTKHPEFRDSFYNQRVVNSMIVRMKHRAKQFDSLMQISNLLLNIFFRFGTEIDIQFVRQFFTGGVLKFIMRSVQMHNNEWNRRNTLHVFFPMIGLAEIPEGRAWIWKNVLEVSEYFNHFDKDQLDVYLRDEKTEWFLENGNFKEINRVWVHFYNEVNRMQTEQREKHMMELLQQEEEDKNKKEKRLEKLKQKKEEKIKKLESNATVELLESWSTQAPSEEEWSDSDDGLNTCKNANAIAGSSSEAIADTVSASENIADYINVSSQPQNGATTNVFKWTALQSEALFDQFQKGNEDDWTTVQTKKNKEKERHVLDRQNMVRHSPIQNSKRKKSAIQKQKKKKDSKPIQVPLNAFTTQFSAPALGPTRWADIAKGVTKPTPQINAGDKSFPKPKPTVNGTQMELAELNKQNKKFVDNEFPCLDSHQTQWDKKEKPSKMTFHFHAEQPECNSNWQGDNLDEESVDIEQAELELQELEAYKSNMKAPANEDVIKERNIRPSQSSECFMCDPEYTDDSKISVFDPTKLTDEEISSFNTRGKILSTESKLVHSDTSQGELESNVKDTTMDMQKDNRNNTSRSQQWMKNIELANLNERLDDVIQVCMSSNIQKESDKMQLNGQQINGQGFGIPQQAIDKNAGFMLKPVLAGQESFRPVDSGGSGYIPSKTSGQKKKEKKNCATVSVPNIQHQDLSDTKIPVAKKNMSTAKRMTDQQRKSTTITAMAAASMNDIPSEAESQLLKHQTKTYAAFEKQLNRHESEHFIELVVSLSPISEPKPNIIDDLFNSPEEIPEWLNENEEIPKEEEVWDAMTHHSTPIKQPSKTDDKQQSQSYCISPENSMEIVAPQIKFAPKQNTSPYDLSVTDPAIIHCSKRPGCIEQNSTNVPGSLKNEHENISFINPQKTGVAQLQDPDRVATLLPQGNSNIEPMNKLNNLEKQTAVIKPLGLLSANPLPAANCSFGQKLLENACKLEDADKSDDSFLYPDDLDGEPYETDDEQSTKHASDDDEFYFPSFHQDTMLSAHHNENDVSITHRMQQLQLEQIKDYYSRCKDQITDDNSINQSKFLYFAQSAGMEKHRIEQHLQGKVEIEQKDLQRTQNVHPVLPTKPSRTHKRPDGKKECHQSSDQQLPVCNNTEAQGQCNLSSTGAQVPSMQQVPVHDKNTQFYDNVAANNAAQGMTQQQVQLLPVVPYVLLRPFLPPPSHPANIRNIQSQQAAMSSSVKIKIQEIIESMFRAKAKSVRWRNELARMRNFPPEKLMVVGKIVIPRDDCDRVYIAYHSTGATILGYLCDGIEVAVKITDSKIRPIKPDELDKILSVDSSQPFLNRYRAIEEFNGNYYIAMDLNEYSLPEYLQIIRKDDTIDEKIAVEKLVFQLLRAFLALHQTYLIVHAELRPDNIVIDIDGNLKVSGYGIGRNMERDPLRYSEYSDEDKCWLAPEVLINKQAMTFKMDIFAVGMLIYYIYKGGKNPFGSEPREIIQNICTQNYRMEYISDEAGHLLSMMLSINKIDRPAIADALKHPLFWADEKRLRFVSIVGSDIVWELKHSVLERYRLYSAKTHFLLDKKQRENTMAAIVSMSPCNISLVRWTQAIEPAVMKEMKGFRQYKSNLVDLVIFLYNCCNHFETLSPKVREIIDEPCLYFLTKFPTLFMTVYRTIKFSNRRDKTCYKPFF